MARSWTLGLLLLAAILGGGLATLAWGDLGVGPRDLVTAAHGGAGTKVSADRPVQVLSGDWCASIWSQLFCDHLVEAIDVPMPETLSYTAQAMVS